jgi:hypothetical protein
VQQVLAVELKVAAVGYTVAEFEVAVVGHVVWTHSEGVAHTAALVAVLFQYDQPGHHHIHRLRPNGGFVLELAQSTISSLIDQFAKK